MKKIFVMLPPKYCLTEEQLKEYERQREGLCHKAEMRLDEYCEVSYLSSYSLRAQTDDEEYLRKEFVRDNLEQLLNSDYAVFVEGCKESEECRLVRYVAEAYGVEILEV